MGEWVGSSKNQAGDRKPFCQHIHQLHQCPGDNVGRRVKKQCMGGALLTHKWRRGQVLGWGVTRVLDGCGGWALGARNLGTGGVGTVHLGRFNYIKLSMPPALAASPLVLPSLV